jgi:hypothetical protein
MATPLVEIYTYEVKDGLFHSTRRQPNEIFSLLHDLNRPLFVSCSTIQPRTQDLSLGKTLAAPGHVPRPKFSARGGVVKVSNYMLPVGYNMYVYKPLKT